MAKERLQRRLAAILAADVVGYSRLMGTNEASTLARIKALRAELIDPTISANAGRIVKLMGDGMLVEFASAVDAVTCALEIQREMVEKNKAELPDERIQLRIGINVGDIIIEGDDIFGDGVNLAARLEGLAAPGGICISRGVHDQVRGKLDAVFEDGGEQQLKNIAEPVRIFRAGPKLHAAPTGNAVHSMTPVFARSPKPSLAVLPFQNMSGDLDQEPFCDGLVEDIITTLSKLGGLSIIARNSTFVYKGRAVDVREAAKQLGVRYVLEGSVRKSGNRIRVTTQLIDAEDGTHLWAERYDRTMDDIFAIQDEITLMLATEMQVKFTEGEQARLHYTTTTNVEAWTHWAQGLAHHRQAVSAEAQTLARKSWEKALALDPHSASLSGELGFLHSLDARFAWWDDRETAIKKALAYIDRSFAIDANSAVAFTAFSLALLFQGQHDKAIAAARRAVELAPGSADTAQLASYVFSGSGLPEEAVALCERAIKLNPNYPGAYLGTLGQAYRLIGRIEQALAAFQAYHARNPGFGLTDIVIIYQQNGRLEEAKETLAELLKARPNLTLAAFLKTQFFHRDRAQIEADAAALRAAGLPEG